MIYHYIGWAILVAGGLAISLLVRNAFGELGKYCEDMGRIASYEVPDDDVLRNWESQEGIAQNPQKSMRRRYANPR